MHRLPATIRAINGDDPPTNRIKPSSKSRNMARKQAGAGEKKYAGMRCLREHPGIQAAKLPETAERRKYLAAKNLSGSSGLLEIDRATKSRLCPIAGKYTRSDYGKSERVSTRGLLRRETQSPNSPARRVGAKRDFHARKNR